MPLVLETTMIDAAMSSRQRRYNNARTLNESPAVARFNQFNDGAGEHHGRGIMHSKTTRRRRRRRCEGRIRDGGTVSSSSISTRSFSSRRTYRTTTTTTLPIFLTLLASLLGTARAGLSFGGATSTDSCYAALRNAKRPNENVVDRQGFVKFISEMSDGAFLNLQKDDEGEWGMLPVKDFDMLPSGVRGEFWTAACGGPFVICPDAYLYTDGIDDEEGVRAQQIVYLFQLCKGVEDAIEEARPKPTPRPTTSRPTAPALPDDLPKPALPQCTPLYGADGDTSSYRPGDIVSNPPPSVVSAHNGAPDYFNYQCKDGNGKCGQAAYEPGLATGGNWEEAWSAMGGCALGQQQTTITTPPTPTLTAPTFSTTTIATATPTITAVVAPTKPVFPSPPTYTPTVSKPPTTKPVTVVKTVANLAYQAVVVESVTAQDLNNVNNPMTQQLLVSMTVWSQKTEDALAEKAKDVEGGSRMRGRTRRRTAEATGAPPRSTSRGLTGRRELLILPVPVIQSATEDPASFEVVDVACITPTQTPTDHCIQVTTNLTLILEDEPVDSVNATRIFFEDEFNKDLQNGVFYGMLSNETQEEMRSVYPVPPEPTETGGGINLPPGPSPDDIPPVPNPATVDMDTLIKIIADSEAENEDKGGGGAGSIVGIVCGVVVGFALVGVGFFVYRRRHSLNEDGSFYSKDDETPSFRKRDFDPADDLEGGNLGSPDEESRSSGSEFSSSESQSSGSMQSYSGSDGDDGSDGSSYTSQSGSFAADSRSSSGQGNGPPSVSASESGSYSSGNVSDGRTPPKQPPPPVAAGAIVDRMASQESITSGSAASNSHGDSMYSNHESTGSSVGDASDPAHHQQRAGGTRKDGSTGSRSGRSRSGSRSGKGSRSAESASQSSEGYRANVDLMDSDQGGGFGGSKMGSTPTDDDSSAGSSGWDSSDGESSTNTGSVDSFDPDDINSASYQSTKSGSNSGTITPQSGSTPSTDSDFDRSGDALMNPAVNPVVQRGVTMLPIAEADHESSGSGITTLGELGRHEDQAPLGGDIQEAIEKGDWAAVGATAAVLATSSGSDRSVSSGGSDDGEEDPDGTPGNSSNGMRDSDLGMSMPSSNEDSMRAAEIDALVENGNWDGVVAVAARYADEADEADISLGRPIIRGRESSRSPPSNDRTSPNDSRSVSRSASVESYSHATYSVGGSMGVSTDQSASTTASGSDPNTHSDQSSHAYTESASESASTITSSASRGEDAISSSMVSAVSTVDVQEKRQMNAYRAEVEALIRRVVPDEIENVDDIMVQFSGREEELIETLRAMQEKSIAQRARAAVQRSARSGAGARTGRDAGNDESSEDLGQSVTTDGGETYSTRDSDGQSYTSGSYTTNSRTTVTDGTRSASSRSTFTDGTRYASVSSRDASGRKIRGRDGGGSITEQFTESEDDTMGDDDHSSSSSRSSGPSSQTGSEDMSSYSSAISDGRSGSAGSSQDYSNSIGVISVEKSEHSDYHIVKTSPGLSEAIDASDWRAVGDAAQRLTADGVSSSNPSHMTGMSQDTRDEMDDMIDDGNWSGIIDAASSMRGEHMDHDGGGNAEDLD